ncbi:MAG: iron hydrogenase small subunit [Butyricicoccus sp.]
MKVSKKVKSSHNNVTLEKLYNEYLSYPCSARSEELLHTKYTERG